MTRSRTIDELFHIAIQKAVLWAAVGFWALEAFMNFVFGLKISGLGLAGVLLAVAVFAAYLGVKFFSIQGWDRRTWLRRGLIGVPLALCVGVSQVAGWSTMGTMLADGLKAREIKALGLSTAEGALELAIAERQKIGTPRTIGALEAELNLELRKTSRAYPNGDGPNAMKLRAELAQAQRAAELDTQIPQMTEALGKRDQVADGNPHLDVMNRITGAAPEEIAFWIPVGLTLIVGFFANFGFPLAGVRFGHDEMPAPHRLAGALPRHPDIFDDFGEYGTPLPSRLRGGAYAWQQPQAEYPHELHETARSPVSHSAPQPPVPLPDRVSAPAATHNPITINVGGATSHGGTGAAAPGGAASDRRLLRGRGAAPDARGRRMHEIRDVQALPTPVAPRRPVDRTRLEEILDRLITFKAACLTETPGAVTPLDEIYARYHAWSGGRAIEFDAFKTMLPMVDVARVEVGGVWHCIDVGLRNENRQLQIATG